MQNESSGVGGCGTEICTNLRLLVMSGDKLHQQKESGPGGGGRRSEDREMEGDERGRNGGETKRYYKYRGYSDFGMREGDPLCRVSR